MPPWKPPQTGNLPAAGKRIMRRCYIGFRNANPQEDPNIKRIGASVCWRKVRAAGFTKKSYAKH